MSLSCGVSVGLAEAPDWAGRPGTGTKSRRPPDPNDHFPVTQCHQGDLAGCSNSAHIDYDARTLVRETVAHRAERPVRWPDTLAGALPNVSFSLVSHHSAARTVTITIYARVLSVTDRRMLVSGRKPG